MSKRQEIREKRRQQERMQRVIAIVGIVLVAAVIVGWVILSQQPPKDIVKPDPVDRPQVNSNATGDPNAPVKMIEYADFQCPYCMHFWRDTEKQIIDAYVKTGKVYLEYHSVGAFIGPESSRAAEAAYCAGDQGKFWELHDTFYANQGEERSGWLADAKIVAFARSITGLDMTQFDSCFTGGKYSARVEQDSQDAFKNIPAASNFGELVAAQQYSAQGVSTPSFLINGRLVPGAVPFTTFQQEIDAALAAAGQK